MFWASFTCSTSDVVTTSFDNLEAWGLECKYINVLATKAQEGVLLGHITKY